MNPIMGGIFILGGSVLLSVFSNISKNTNKPPEYKIAKEIIKKKDYIKKYSALSTILSSDGSNENISQITKKNITTLVLPSMEYSKNDILLLSSYQLAIQDYFKHNDPSITPNCSNLNTDIISKNDCEIAESLNVSFFEIHKGDIAFTTSKEVGKYIKELEPNLNVLTETDIDISFIDRFSDSEYSSKQFEKIQETIKKYQNEVEGYIGVDLITAANINKRLAQIDTNKAINNVKNIFSTMNRHESLSVENNTSLSLDFLYVFEKIKYEKMQNGMLNVSANIPDDIDFFIKANLTENEIEELQLDVAAENLNSDSIILGSLRGLE